MKVSYNWLQEYFDEKLPTPKELGELLTFHAYEVEEIEKAGDDHILDIDVLPNRSSDSLSHRGIAREIATLLGKILKSDPLSGEALQANGSKKLRVEVKEPELCSRYAAAVIEGVTVGPSPTHLKTALESLGQRSINNIVDATNYVMLSTGQPLHAFDMDKLEGDVKNITVRNAAKGEKITTLTGDDYTLDERTLLITDGNTGKAIGIAGVKGGKAAEVDDKTRNVIIEAAHFDARRIRKTAQRLKLWTDASTRFQNDPSPLFITYALRDVVKLILEVAKGGLEGVVDVAVPEKAKSPVVVTLSQINGLLGTALTDKEVRDILERLAFSYTADKETYTVTIPFERTDLNIYEDLIEEVGRVYGYEHLKARELPDLKRSVEIDQTFAYADRIRNILTNAGYSEVITYTFRQTGDLKAISAVASDKSYLRTGLRDGIKECTEMNAKNAPLFGLERIRLFEIGHVFPKTGEYTALALGVSGKKTDEVLLEAKALLEKELGAKISEKPKDGVLEIDLSKLIASLPPLEGYDPYEQNLTKYTEFSQYPFVLRDIAVWVPKGTDEEQLLNIVRKDAGDLLIRTTKFDEFTKDERTSYAYHLVFQSPLRTLTDDEIGKIMDKISQDLDKKEGFEVR